MSTILGIYKIIRKLGRGGFGEVYLVVDQQDKNWAIKEMSKKKIAS
jgi:serine/threonine protein kinase